MISRLRTSHVRPTTHAGHELAAARIRARVRALLCEDNFEVVHDDDELDLDTPIETTVGTETNLPRTFAADTKEKS